MKSNWWPCVSLLFIMVVSCGPKFEGYTEVAPGLHRKLASIGESGPSAGTKDFVLLDYALETPAGQPMDGALRWLHRPDSTAFGSDVTGAQILGLNPGDSLVLMAQWLHLKSGFWRNRAAISDTTWVRLRVLFADHATADEFAGRYRSFWLEPEEEDQLLADYLSKSSNAEYRFRKGIYFRKIETGLGDTLQTGDEVIMGCKGTFLNGKTFDDTYQGKHLWITYGRPDQLIPGLQMAVWKACKGDSIEAILPSYLAFGERGSSSGIVPPYTPVCYRFRIIDVRTLAENSEAQAH